MLYRPAPRTPLKAHAASLVRALAGLLSASTARRSDAAYLESLNEHGLRDLGIRRVEARDYHRFY